MMSQINIQYIILLYIKNIHFSTYIFIFLLLSTKNDTIDRRQGLYDTIEFV